MHHRQLCRWALPPLLLLLCLAAVSAAAVDKCDVCGRLVDAFAEGVQRTARDNFGGGNTHWEESRLGSYAHSETRLVDIQERLCTGEAKEDAAACHALLEQFEEALEAWWFGEFRTGAAPAVLRDLLCVRRAGICCPHGAYGPECAACPDCAPRGTCDGNGTRGGTGRCQCDSGYQGDLCAECAIDHYRAAGDTAAAVTCLACHPACGPGGCLDGATPADCRRDCAPGYAPAVPTDAASGGDDNGRVVCIDVDECAAASPACPGQNERCINSPGSFACECEPGHLREAGACVPEQPAAEANKSAESSNESAESGDKSTESGNESTESGNESAGSSAESAGSSAESAGSRDESTESGDESERQAQGDSHQQSETFAEKDEL